MYIGETGLGRPVGMLGSEPKAGDEGKGKGLGESQHRPSLPPSPFSLSFFPLEFIFHGRNCKN